MKLFLLLVLAIPAVVPAATAAVYVYSGPAYSIPDGNPIGVFTGITVSGEQPYLTSVSVMLNLSNGYNGDLYAYLNHNGKLVPLLNRPGLSGGNPFGWDGAGMNVTLTDSAASNIHAAGNGFLSGPYRPDGEDISPLSSAAAFNANGGAITLNGTFGNLDPNGNWTLFITDVVSGGNSTMLNGWSLNLTSIPEPNLFTLALLALTGAIVRRRR